MAQLLTAFPLAQDGWGHMDMDSGWGIVMVAGMILLWGLVIAGIVWLLHDLAGRRERGSGRTPLDVLDHRLASGEITPQEYEERRRLLSPGR